MNVSQASGTNWYVVQTKVRQERVARDQLERQQFETYLPMVRIARRKGQKWHHVVEPLFAGYLFVKLDLSRQNVAPVRSTRGVRGLVKFGEEIRPVPNEIIDALANSHAGDDKQPIDPATLFEQGDPIDFVEGPFAGAQGIFRAQTGTERVAVLLSLLGQHREVMVSAHVIAPRV